MLNTAQEKERAEQPMRAYNPLINNGAYFVLVSHRELDTLIARFMHLAELDSDIEHRNAMKGELKSISRNWLDNLYEDAGYKNHCLDNTGQVVDLVGMSTAPDQPTSTKLRLRTVI